MHLLTASGGSADSSAAVAVHPAVSGLAGRVGDHAALITWTSGGTGPTLVRDVTASSPARFTPDRWRGRSGHRAQRPRPGFTNTVSRTYAVWATDTDGTTSDAAGDW